MKRFFLPILSLFIGFCGDLAFSSECEKVFQSGISKQLKRINLSEQTEESLKKHIEQIWKEKIETKPKPEKEDKIDLKQEK